MNTNTSCTFQELGVLFNTIIKSWKAHPNHFGTQSFDDFLKSLPNFYYHLVNYQHQIQQIRQQQQQNILIQQQQQQMIKEQQLKEQQLKEQQLREKQLKEQQLKEQQLKEQQLKEQKMREQQLKEQQLKEQQLKEQQLKEQQEKEEQQKKEQEKKQLIVVVDSKDTEKEENTLKLTQKQRNYRSRSSIKPRLGSIDEEKPLTVSPSCSPFSSPSVSPIPPSIANLNAAAPEFVPSFDSNDSDDSDNNNEKEQKTTTTITTRNKPYKILEKFVPYHAARAKLNIYIPKHMTKSVLSMIDESFPNTNTLYYYLDISTATQINDGQMDVIQVYYLNNQTQEKEEKKIVLINFDLHKKGTKEILYAVVTPNDKHKIEANTHKWLWKLEEFLTENELYNKYEITNDDLPNSSRLMKNGIYDQFITEKQKLNEINFMSLLKEYKWNLNEIKIIGSSQKSKKNKKNHEIKVTLNSNLWINSCINSLNNNIDNIPLIPIVVYENRDINKHWIEWVQLIYIQQKNSFVGLTFKYNDNNNQWQIESVCLDRGDIHNKHRLIGLQNINLHNNDNNNNGQCINNIINNNNYDEYFNKFNTTITEIEWQ